MASRGRSCGLARKHWAPACQRRENSNQKPGTNCTCADGFDGKIVWEEDIPRGPCHPAKCDISNSNRKIGLACRCLDGFQGEIIWNGSIPTGTCTPAPCNIQNSNKISGPRCECKNMYTGQFSWYGPKVTGQCEPVKCDGKRLNGKPGEKCRCADGYAGMPLVKFHSDLGEVSDEACTPAECTIPNAIGKGPECRCADKFVGKITWKGAFVSGKCVPAPCKFLHSNNKPGPDCACAFGYEQVMPIRQFGGKLLGICKKIPCLGVFSNHQGGPGCRCADGYKGTVQLVTAVETRFSAAGPASRNFTAFQTDCVPAKCDVENTIGDGTECRCKDGYQGSVTWMGSFAYGACKPAHCFIDKSNGKPGPQCSCLDG